MYDAGFVCVNERRYILEQIYYIAFCRRTLAACLQQ